MIEHPLEIQMVQMAEALWDPGIPLVVAISGGIDSMALYALLEAIESVRPVTLHPVHVHHGLRRAADEDAEWLSGVIEEHYGRSLVVLRVDATTKPGESLEMAARRARYGALFEYLGTLGEQARLAVAHQLDDQAETVLMRALMGTGITGLGGIHRTRGPIVRPLLSVSRARLQAYLVERHIPWREDETNQDLAVLRNRIRHQLMDWISREVNPRAAEALARLADDAQREREGLDLALDRILRGEVYQSADRLVLEPSWTTWPPAWTIRILERFAHTCHLRLAQHHYLTALKTSITWPGGVQVEHRPDGRLEVRRRIDVILPPPMVLPDTGVLNFGAFRIETRWSRPEDAEPGWTVINGRWPTIIVRCWQPGDRLTPLGMKGYTKKVQDVFVDAKIPKGLRASWPIVVAENGPILAILGVRVSEEARATPGQPVWLVRVVPPDIENGPS